MLEKNVVLLGYIKVEVGFQRNGFTFSLTVSTLVNINPP
jgi:hypothetical protein